jgi:hypothetical protein
VDTERVKPVGIIAFVVVVVVVALVVILSGWADDNAKPGSTGRVQVTSAEPR